MINTNEQISPNLDFFLLNCFVVIKEVCRHPPKEILKFTNKCEIKKELLYILLDYFIILDEKEIFIKCFDQIINYSENSNLSYKFYIILKKFCIKYFNQIEFVRESNQEINFLNKLNNSILQNNNNPNLNYNSNNTKDHYDNFINFSSYMKNTNKYPNQIINTKKNSKSQFINNNSTEKYISKNNDLFKGQSLDVEIVQKFNEATPKNMSDNSKNQAFILKNNTKSESYDFNFINFSKNTNKNYLKQNPKLEKQDFQTQIPTQEDIKNLKYINEQKNVDFFEIESKKNEPYLLSDANKDDSEKVNDKNNFNDSDKLDDSTIIENISGKEIVNFSQNKNLKTKLNLLDIESNFLNERENLNDNLKESYDIKNEQNYDFVYINDLQKNEKQIITIPTNERALNQSFYRNFHNSTNLKDRNVISPNHKTEKIQFNSPQQNKIVNVSNNVSLNSKINLNIPNNININGNFSSYYLNFIYIRYLF